MFPNAILNGYKLVCYLLPAMTPSDSKENWEVVTAIEKAAGSMSVQEAEMAPQR